LLIQFTLFWPLTQLAGSTAALARATKVAALE